MKYVRPKVGTYIEEGQSRANLLNASLAKLLEGEGNFGLIKSSKNSQYPHLWSIAPRIRISMCNKPIMEWARDAIYSITHKKYKLRKSESPGQKHAMYELNVLDQKGASKICKTLLPYLIGKREQAEIIIEFCELRKSRKHTGFNGPGRRTYDEKDFDLLDRMKKATRVSYSTPIVKGVETERFAPQVGEATVRACSNVR